MDDLDALDGLLSAGSGSSGSAGPVVFEGPADGQVNRRVQLKEELNRDVTPSPRFRRVAPGAAQVARAARSVVKLEAGNEEGALVNAEEM